MPKRPRFVRFFASLVLAVSASMTAIPQASAQPSGFSVSPAGAYLAARAAELRSDLATAARYYQVVFLDDPENIALAARIMSLWVEAGQVHEAVPFAERIIANDPGYEPARLVLATDAFANENFAEAEVQLSGLAGDAFSDLSVILLSAWAEAGRGEVDSALAMLEEVDPQSAALADFHAALITDFAGRTDEALAFMVSVYTPDQTQRVVEAYARMLARVGRTDEALAAIDAYLEGTPDHPRLNLLRDQIESSEAIEPLIPSAAVGAAEVHYGLAASLVGIDEFDIAINYLQLGRYLAPDFDLATVLLGQLLQAQQRHAEAVAVLDMIGTDSPYAVAAAISASISDASRGEEEAAITRLVAIVNALPTETTAAETLATIYRSEMRWQEANEVLSATIDALSVIEAEHWRLFYQRGITYERMGEWAEAERDLERALVLSPGETDVLNYLGYSWLEQGVNYLEAFDMIQQAVQQRPGAGYIIDSLGWAYYKLGDYDAAVATLERAVELTPNHAEILDHLGDALWRAGREVEARFQWNHALQYEPTPEMIERIEYKLEQGLEPLPDDVPAEGIMEIH